MDLVVSNNMGCLVSLDVCPIGSPSRNGRRRDSKWRGRAVSGMVNGAGLVAWIRPGDLLIVNYASTILTSF